MSSRNWFLNLAKRLGVRNAEDYVVSEQEEKEYPSGYTDPVLKKELTKIPGISEGDMVKFKPGGVITERELKEMEEKLFASSIPLNVKAPNKMTYEGKVTLPHFGVWTFITKKGDNFVCSVNDETFETENFWDAMLWISNQFGVDINEDSNGDSQT